MRINAKSRANAFRSAILALAGAAIVSGCASADPAPARAAEATAPSVEPRAASVPFAASPQTLATLGVSRWELRLEGESRTVLGLAADGRALSTIHVQAAPGTVIARGIDRVVLTTDAVSDGALVLAQDVSTSG